MSIVVEILRTDALDVAKLGVLYGYPLLDASVDRLEDLSRELLYAGLVKVVELGYAHGVFLLNVINVFWNLFMCHATG